MLNMILDETISNDCKILYIIELLHAENISLEKAKELMFESGLVKKPAIVLDVEVMNEFTKRYIERLKK
jgi:hypothetical protein